MNFVTALGAFVDEDFEGFDQLVEGRHHVHIVEEEQLCDAKTTTNEGNGPPEELEKRSHCAFKKAESTPRPLN